MYEIIINTPYLAKTRHTGLFVIKFTFRGLYEFSKFIY